MKPLSAHPLALAIALAGICHNSVAEETPQTAQETAVEEISVVGQRVSYANSSTNDVMQQSRSSLSNVMDMVDDLPGVKISQGDAFGSDDYTTTITMRGFVVTRNDQQLGITVDGLPNGGSAYGGGSKANRFLDSENTETVEVGQGTADIASASLDALGGTLNFVSANPMAERNTRIDLTSGDYNARKTFIRHDTGLINDNTTAYFSLSDSYNNRWMGTGSNGYSERLHAEAKSVTELSKARITARLSYDDVHEDNYDFVSMEEFRANPTWDRLTNFWTGNPDKDQNFAEAWSTLRENTFLYVKGEFFLADNMTLDVTPYLHVQSGRGDWLPPYQVYASENGQRVSRGGSTTNYWWVDGNGNPVLDGDGKGIENPADTTGLTRVSSYRHSHYDKTRYGFTSNLKWQLANHTLRAGLWAEENKRNITRDWHSVIDPEVSYEFDNKAYWTHFDRDYTTSTLKFYLQDAMQFGDLGVTLGAQKYLVDIDFDDAFVSSRNHSLNSNSDLLASLGLVYSLSHELEVFAGYSENYKALPDTIMDSGKEKVKSADAETAENIDFGVRYFGDSIDASVTGYLVQFDNRLTELKYGTVDDGTPDYLATLNGEFQNLGGINSRGVEVAAEWRMTDTVSLNSSLSHNRSVYSKDVKDDKSDYRKDDLVAGIPQNNAYLALSYDNDGYRAGLSASHTSRYYGVANGGNAESIPGYNLANLYIGYNGMMSEGSLFKSFDISFVINNLTDETYITGGQEGAYMLGAARTAAMTGSLNF